MPIPELVNIGGLKQLPPGQHPATFQEIETVYGSTTDRRKELMKNLVTVGDMMRKAKVSKIWVDGSFITDKPEPNDIDGCWSAAGVTETDARVHIDPIFFERDWRFKVQEKYKLDFFIAEATEGSSGLRFPEFFQSDRDGNQKGILVVTL